MNGRSRFTTMHPGTAVALAKVAQLDVTDFRRNSLRSC